MKKTSKLVCLMLSVVMLLSVIPANIFAAATDISVTSAAYHDNGDVKSINIKFGWNSASASSRLTVMTERLRSAGESGTNGSHGDFTDLGYYGKKFDSWDAVVEQEDKFGILYYTDEQRIQEGKSNSITLHFDEGDIPVNVDKTYYVYLWTYWGGYYYPDNLFMVIQVKNGLLQYASAKGRNDYGSFTVLEEGVWDTSDSSSTTNSSGTSDYADKPNTSPSQSTGGADSASAKFNELSLNEYEWEILRLCNIERAKEGIDSLRMTSALQSACDTRETELQTFYSHTRPTRQSYTSAIPYSFKWKKSAENIANGKKTPGEVVSAWMSDKTQKANILNPDFDYVGIGYNSEKNLWVQIFTDSTSEIDGISINDTAKEIREYTESELSKYIATVTAKDGCISYMPLSFYSMKKDGEYCYPRLGMASLPKFKNTGEEIPDSYYYELQEKKPEEEAPPAEPEPDNLFERFIPIEQVYSTRMLNIVSYAPWQIRTFPIGTRLLDMTKSDGDEYKSAWDGTTIFRNKYVGYYVKFNYLGTYGEQKETFVNHYLDILGEDDYYKVINGEESYQAQLMNITKDTIVVSVDLYDQDKDYIRHLYPACIILAADEEGSFITLSAYTSPAMNFAYTRITENPIAVLFSQKNDYFAPDTDAGEAALEIEFKVREVGFTDKSKVEKLLSPSLKKAQTTVEPQSKFTDVPADAWYAAPVQWAVDKGITTGTSATTFSPDNTCTKAQIITFLWRAVGSPKLDGFNQFTDVKESDYFYHAALWASSKGMVSGNRFEPDALCTRSATVVYLWKNAGSPQASYEGNFTDVSWGTDYATAVAWAVSNGVTSGTSATTFSPNTTCTRGQIVTFLQRALK